VKIEIARRASLQVERASSWWHKNRPSAPLLFEHEFERALTQLASTPRAGLSYPTARRPAMKRLLLAKTGYHVYFALERNETVVVIHSVWGARRGRGPKL
jgi:plasmid stabilization system protein ParE